MKQLDVDCFVVFLFYVCEVGKTNIALSVIPLLINSSCHSTVLLHIYLIYPVYVLRDESHRGR